MNEAKRKAGRPFGTFKNGFPQKSNPLYGKWSGMKQRCLNPKSHIWKYYGGRGIKVCARWLEKSKGFENFVTDMGERPTPKHTVGRIDNNGDYEPGNCGWATMTEQSKNRRPGGVPRDPNSLRGKCRAAGLPYMLFYLRIKNLGWTEERALTTPKLPRGRQVGARFPRLNPLEGFEPLPESAFKKQLPDSAA